MTAQQIDVLKEMVAQLTAVTEKIASLIAEDTTEPAIEEKPIADEPAS